MGKTAVIMIGIQASGKSTFSKAEFPEYVRINLDTLKTRHREKQLLEQCIQEGQSFVVDNTNPTRAERARYIPLAKAAGYRVVGYFMESKVRPCMERNERREDAARVPVTAIAATSNKLEMPRYEEGFDALYFVGTAEGTTTISPWREER